MKSSGYSLIEVMVAAAIVAVGLTGAAVLAATLMRQEELNSSVLRAANLQEQAIALYRLGIEKSEIVALLPEATLPGSVPTDGKYAIDFADLTSTNLEASDGTTFTVDVTTCTMVFPDPAGDAGLVTNTASVVIPGIRAY